MKKAALYARVSTQKQEQEETINNQINAIEKQIKTDGNILVPECVYKDDGWSGALLARPELDRMRLDSKKHLFEVLYVYDRGRLARKLAYQEILIEGLKDQEIDFITLKDSDEPFVQAVQGIFYEFERAKIYERFRLGKLEKVMDGKLLGYNPLYGYDYVAKTKKRNGYFTINPKEAEVVKQIFSWVGIEHISLREVIRRLHKLNILPRKQKRPTWTKGPIARMLREETYIGNHYYLKTEAVISTNTNLKYHRVKKNSRKNRPKEEWIKIKVPAIIDKGLFEKVQRQIELNKKFAPRNTKREYLIQGLIYCPCGQRRTGEGLKEHQYYRCTDRLHRFPLEAKCNEGSVNSKVLDTVVWNKLINYISHPEVIKKQANRWIQKKQEEQNARPAVIQGFENDIKTLDEEAKRYSFAYGQGIMPIEIYQERMEDLEKRKLFLQNKIKAAQLEKPKPSQTEKTMSDEVAVTIAKLDYSDKKFIIRQLITKVVADRDKVAISGNIPVNITNMELHAKDRNSRLAECWQVDAV